MSTTFYLKWARKPYHTKPVGTRDWYHLEYIICERGRVRAPDPGFSDAKYEQKARLPGLAPPIWAPAVLGRCPAPGLREPARARRKHRVRRTPPEDPGAQTYKSLPRRVGGASRSSCRVLCAQVQPVITWGSCPRGRGSRWRSWRSTPPRKQAGRAQTHRRRVRATASTERTSSTVRRPAQLTSPAAIDPALPPPRRADTRRSVEDGGDGKERQAGCGRAAVDCGRRRRSGEWRARCDAPAAELARRPRPCRPHRRHPHLRARRRPRRRRPL